jgi:hypothetical protein
MLPNTTQTIKEGARNSLYSVLSQVIIHFIEQIVNNKIQEHEDRMHAPPFSQFLSGIGQANTNPPVGSAVSGNLGSITGPLTDPIVR